MTTTAVFSKPVTAGIPGMVHCPMCTHTVSATVEADRRSARVKAGQKCPRCHSTLDAAFVVRVERAA